MSTTYTYRVSVALPTRETALSPGQSKAIRPVSGVAAGALTGALAGTLVGLALGVGAAGLVPGIGLGVEALVFIEGASFLRKFATVFSSLCYLSVEQCC